MNNKKGFIRDCDSGLASLYLERGATLVGAPGQRASEAHGSESASQTDHALFNVVNEFGFFVDYDGWILFPAPRGERPPIKRHHPTLSGTWPAVRVKLLEDLSLLVVATVRFKDPANKDFATNREIIDQQKINEAACAREWVLVLVDPNTNTLYTDKSTYPPRVLEINLDLNVQLVRPRQEEDELSPVVLVVGGEVFKLEGIPL